VPGGEPTRSARRNSPLASHYLIDALDGNAKMFGERDLGPSKRFEELVTKELPRALRITALRPHGLSPVIVDESNVMDLRSEHKSDERRMHVLPCLIQSAPCKDLPER